MPYADHLAHVQGLASATITYRLRYVLIHGKGRKQRSVPLWRKTIQVLRLWLKQSDHSPQAHLLPNARGDPMTRAGIAQRLQHAVQKAAKSDPSLLNRRISPHTIRHTTAMHLLQSGVDLSVIAACFFLGCACSPHHG